MIGENMLNKIRGLSKFQLFLLIVNIFNIIATIMLMPYIIQLFPMWFKSNILECFYRNVGIAMLTPYYSAFLIVKEIAIVGIIWCLVGIFKDKTHSRKMFIFGILAFICYGFFQLIIPLFGTISLFILMIFALRDPRPENVTRSLSKRNWIYFIVRVLLTLYIIVGYMISSKSLIKIYNFWPTIIDLLVMIEVARVEDTRLGWIDFMLINATTFGSIIMLVEIIIAWVKKRIKYPYFMMLLTLILIMSTGVTIPYYNIFLLLLNIMILIRVPLNQKKATSKKEESMDESNILFR